jgi:hypothetical protein
MRPQLGAADVLPVTITILLLGGYLIMGGLYPTPGGALESRLSTYLEGTEGNQHQNASDRLNRHQNLAQQGYTG